MTHPSSGAARGLALALTFTFATTACGPLVRSTYPATRWEGEASGLSAPVQIYLDAMGVPHIFASNDDDAALAVGFMHGRDRQFQMELIRLASHGRLTELLGKSMLDTDRRLRLLSYKLEEAVANLVESDRRRVEAYCKGINLAAEQTERPLEFKLLGHTPAPWTARDVMAVGRFQSWDLSVDADREATRDRLVGALPQPTLDWLLTPSPHFGVPIIGGDQVTQSRPALPPVPPPPASTALVNARGEAVSQPTSSRPTPSEPGAVIAKSMDQESIDPDGIDREAIARAVETWLEAPLGGSNGWAVAPSRTRSGKAMMAGDPHLDLGWPSIFHELHIHTPEVDVSGATFPGLPMVVIGRTPTLGWTVTTSYADAQDLFRLDIDPSDPGHYLVDGKKEAFETWPQTFKWGKKPEESQTETYRISRFGPVYNAGREARLKPGVTYALSWPGFSDKPLAITRSFDGIYRATTPEQVIAAVEMLPMPSQNWIFATASGHIGYVLGGTLPARRASPLPRDGSVSSTAWTGFLSDADRPRLVDPPSGIIVASNQPILADVSAYNTSAGGNNRAMRITTALETRSDWDAGSLRGLQLDTVNLEAARVTPILLTGAEKAVLQGLEPDRKARIDAMVAALKGWDYAMAPDRNAPLVYEAWRGQLHRQLFARHIKDKALLEDALKLRLTEAPMEVTLFGVEGDAWFDDPATPAVETRNQVIEAALLEAEASLTATLGGDPARWTWGRVHTLTLEHPFATKSYLRPIFGIDPVVMGGGRHCVLAMDHEGVVGDYRATSGPALRQVVVPGVEAGFVLPGGNAGQPHHRNSLNQLTDWLEGRQHLVGGEQQDVARHAEGAILLKPSR